MGAAGSANHVNKSLDAKTYQKITISTSHFRNQNHISETKTQLKKC